MGVCCAELLSRQCCNTCVPGAQHSWGGRKSFRFLLGLKRLDPLSSPLIWCELLENYVNAHPCVIKFADDMFNAISKE